MVAAPNKRFHADKHVSQAQINFQKIAEAYQWQLMVSAKKENQLARWRDQDMSQSSRAHPASKYIVQLLVPACLSFLALEKKEQHMASTVKLAN
jgi:CRISPR/Cas system-associated endonuclease Cas1